MNMLNSAKLILVWFGCLFSDPSVYPTILQIFGDYEKTYHFLGFFFSHRHYYFTYFFHSTESLCSNVVCILNPRGPCCRAASALPSDHADSRAACPQRGSSPYLSHEYLTQSNVFHAHRADLLAWTPWTKCIKIQMNMEGRPRWQIPCVIFSQISKIFSPHKETLSGLSLIPSEKLIK